MSPEVVRAALGWSAIFNLILLTVFFFAFVGAHDFIYNLHRRWFRISVETFDGILYACMAGYKLANVMFFIMPYLTLRLFF